LYVKIDIDYLLYLYSRTQKMAGDDFQKRKTKKDKAHRNAEYNGKYSPKHARMQEELFERRQQTNQVGNPANSENPENDKKTKKDKHDKYKNK
jgi:hypothetical protein